MNINHDLKIENLKLLSKLIKLKLILEYRLKENEIEIIIDRHEYGIIITLNYNRIKYYKISDESYNNKKYELIRNNIIEYIESLNYELTYDNMNYNYLMNTMIFKHK